MGALIDSSPPVPARSALGWRDRYLAWRDRLLTSPSFRQRASRFPLTRAIARRRAARVFDLVAGFVYSQVLVAAVRLRLFDHLAAAPQTPESLAPRLGLDREATERLLAAAVALDLVEPRTGGRFGLGPLGAPLVGNDGVVAMVEHHALLYADLADPVALLRREAPSALLAGYWPYATAPLPQGTSAPQAAAYSELMSASQPLVAEAVLAAVPLHLRACLLDVGGGDGTFLISAARRAPGLRLILFDLPAVVERARHKLAAAGLAGQVRIVAGNFRDDPLPAGADVATLIRVLHDHDDAAALALLRSVFAALGEGGSLVVAEPMADAPGAKAVGDAYFGFYLLAMGRGRPRRADRIAALMREAGFVAVRAVRTAMPLHTSLVIGRRPSAKTPMART